MASGSMIQPRHPRAELFALQVPKFHLADEVYLRIANTRRSDEGAHLITSVPTAGKYTLCDRSGETVKNGNDVDE